MVCFIVSEAAERFSCTFVYSYVNCSHCPFESPLIWKSWVQIATLVINYIKKSLRKVEVPSLL